MPQVQVHGFREYNSGGQVWTTAQDKRGLIYIGVSSGDILEYDGVTWRKIFLPSSVGRSLVADATGRVWVGASGNLGYLSPDASGSLRFVSLLDKIPAQNRSFTDVWQTLPTKQGIFFRSYENLFRWDGKTMQVWSATKATRFEALSLVRGHIYTAQHGTGLEEIQGDDIRPVQGGEAFRDSIKLFLHPYGNNQILISERDGLLSLYDGQKVVPFPTQADSYLKQYRTYTSMLLRDGSICVTTLSGGAVILRPDGSIRTIIDKNTGLPSSDALSVFQDRDGGLWIGDTYGVSRVDVDSPISIYSRESALDVNWFHGAAYTSGADGRSAVCRVVFDPQTHRPLLFPLRGPTQGWTLVHFKDPAHPDSEQFLSATSEGVMKVEGDALVPAMTGIHGLTEQTYFIGQSHKNPSRVFIGHSDSVGSMRWDGKSWIDEGRLPLLYEARNMVEEADGTLWVSGGSSKVLRVKVAPTGMHDSAPEVITQGLGDGPVDTEVIAGQIFATQDRAKSILRWSEADHKFVPDNRFRLPVDEPDASSALVPIDANRFFAGTSSSGTRRLALFTRQPDGSWKADEDTFRDLNRFHVFGANVAPDGAFWFVGEALVRFAPKASPPAVQAIPTAIRMVKAGAQIVFGGTTLPDSTALRLQPTENNLHFQFAALSYANPTGTEYQYLLEGADKDWSPWDKQREANYSGLGPGSYRFRVRSRTDDGLSGEEGDFAFTILPPWYRTTVAYILYALGFIALALAGWVLISRYERSKALRKTKALQEQARALEAVVNERTQEIRAQAAEIAAQKDSIELLSDIGKEITASLDLNTILFKLYERVNQILDASIFGVGLYQAEKHLIEYSLAVERGIRYAPYTRSTDDKNQFAVWCIDHRQPILINDVSAEASKFIPHYEHTGRLLEDGSEAKPPESMIYLPLVAQERVLGVLSAQSFKKNAYTERHLRLLENLAAYTTIALDNAHAYQVINDGERAVRERAAELMTINRISQALATQLDKDQLIQFVGDQIRDLFHAPIAYVALLDRGTMMLHFPYTFGEEAPARPFGTGLTSQIIRTGQPLLINEDMDRNRVRLGVEQIGRQTASYLGVPIPSGGQMIGVISVQSTDQEGRFTEADQRLLSTIASAVGVAFHNAKLFEETRQARAAAEDADAAKSSFLSTVSHELRTPLTSVLGFAKIIRRRLEERLFPLIPEGDRKVQQAKQQVIENLGVVVSEGERLTKLIDDVLDLAKIEAGKFTWNMATVSIADVVERATAATASLFEAKKLNLVREIEPDLPAITGDQDRLIQVVINLISNAVKFTDAGSIACSARREGEDLVVSVRDSGIGIAPTDQSKVFEKFRQVGDTLTDKPKGTGLGLPICKEIVEYHRGRIWVESDPAREARFRSPSRRRARGAQPMCRRTRRIDIEALVKQLHATVAPPAAAQVGPRSRRRLEYSLSSATGAH